jgi:hypothetical protein
VCVCVLNPAEGFCNLAVVLVQAINCKSVIVPKSCDHPLIDPDYCCCCGVHFEVNFGTWIGYTFQEALTRYK